MLGLAGGSGEEGFGRLESRSLSLLLFVGVRSGSCVFGRVVLGVYGRGHCSFEELRAIEPHEAPIGVKYCAAYMGRRCRTSTTSIYLHQPPHTSTYLHSARLHSYGLVGLVWQRAAPLPRPGSIERAEASASRSCCSGATWRDPRPSPSTILLGKIQGIPSAASNSGPRFPRNGIKRTLAFTATHPFLLSHPSLLSPLRPIRTTSFKRRLKKLPSPSTSTSRASSLPTVAFECRGPSPHQHHRRVPSGRLYDGPGIGKSAGVVCESSEESADYLVSLAALEIPEIDLLGISMGSFVAQVVADNRPSFAASFSLEAVRRTWKRNQRPPPFVAPPAPRRVPGRGRRDSS